MYLCIDIYYIFFLILMISLRSRNECVYFPKNLFSFLSHAFSLSFFLLEFFLFSFNSPIFLKVAFPPKKKKNFFFSSLFQCRQLQTPHNKKYIFPYFFIFYKITHSMHNLSIGISYLIIHVAKL